METLRLHAANIALHIIKRTSGDQGFDEMHGHVEDTGSEEYKALENYYFTMYIEPLLTGGKKSKESPKGNTQKIELNETKSDDKKSPDKNKHNIIEKDKSKKSDKVNIEVKSNDDTKIKKTDKTKDSVDNKKSKKKKSKKN